uniref:Importin subunit alpha n=1 Tax=Crassostrea virginica TaxID=6565 RepID=A0A8B8EPR3_CRAVI|nr:importin subunit alpha-2-like [Crassostrea virginica]
MERKSQYKHRAKNVAKIRQRHKEEELAIRKDRKEKLLSSKRFRFLDGEELGDEISHKEVASAVQSLQKTGRQRLENLRTLRQAFSQGTAFIDTFFKVDNALNLLVSIYTGNDLEQQLEAAWCITNISAGSTDHSLAICKQVAPYLVTYLSCGVPQLQDQSAWTLGNLAGDSAECRKLLQAQGIIAPLVQLLQSPHASVVQSAAFALSNLAKESTDTCREMIQCAVIPSLLNHLVYSKENVSVLSEVSWVLTYLATNELFLEDLSAQGVITKIVSLLVSLSDILPHEAQVVTPMLRCLGNICSGPDKFTLEAKQNAELLPSLSKYLTSDLRHVRKETLWVLSNMTGDLDVCKEVAFGPILSHVLEQVPAAFDIKSEALYLLCNLACHGEDICTRLVDSGMLQCVVPVLKSHDVEVLNLALALCEMALRMTTKGKDIFEKECEGMSKLEALEYHSNETIRTTANQILDIYYGE